MSSAYVAKKPKDETEQIEAKIHKIRITLTSKNVKNLEKVCQDLITRSKDKNLLVKVFY